jgi:hypothetical protein
LSILSERILDSKVEAGMPRLAAAPINYLMAIRSFLSVARLWLAALLRARMSILARL